MDKEIVVGRCEALEKYVNSNPLEDERDEPSQEFLDLVDAVLVHIVGTDGLKKYIRSGAIVGYKAGVPGYAVLQVFGFKTTPATWEPKDWDWSFFDPECVEVGEQEILNGLLLGRGMKGESLRSLPRDVARRYLDWIHNFQSHYKRPSGFTAQEMLLR